MKKADERERLVLNALRLRGQVTVAEAVELLGISEATARRLFAQLEKEGKAIRNYGGIKLPVSPDSYSFEKYKKVLDAEKQRIGALAANMVSSGESIYLDCGTTVLKMARALSRRIADGEIRSLNIVTNSIVNLDALADASGCRVILLGGEYNHERRDFSGPIAEKCMEMFHFKRCFLGSEGWSARTGFSTNHLGLSYMNSKAIDRSEKRCVLMDASKFGNEALVTYAQAAQIDALFTDCRPPEEALKLLEEAGVEIIVAPKVTADERTRD